MIYSWALTTFAPENHEQQLQYSTQYFPTEPLSWFQGWLFNSWQIDHETSSPSSAFAHNPGQTEIPEPPCCPDPPCPAAPPPKYTGGMASEHQRCQSVQWSHDNKIANPDTLPGNCCEFYVLGRIPEHMYPLTVEEPFSNKEVERVCYCFVFHDYYGWYDTDLSLLQMHIDNWDAFYPPIHNSLVLIPMEQSILASDNQSGPWAPIDYPSIADLFDELGNLCYNWDDPNQESTCNGNTCLSPNSADTTDTDTCNCPPPPPLPPLPPPPISPLIDFERYIRDTRPSDHHLIVLQGSSAVGQ
jgi:hypothetical protein